MPTGEVREAIQKLKRLIEGENPPRDERFATIPTTPRLRCSMFAKEPREKVIDRFAVRACGPRPSDVTIEAILSNGARVPIYAQRAEIHLDVDGTNRLRLDVELEDLSMDVNAVDAEMFARDVVTLEKAIDDVIRDDRASQDDRSAEVRALLDAFFRRRTQVGDVDEAITRARDLRRARTGDG